MNHRTLLSVVFLAASGLVTAQNCATTKGRLIADFPLNSKNSKAVGFQSDGMSLISRIKPGMEEGMPVNNISLERFLCSGQKDFTFAENGILKSDVHPLNPRTMVGVAKDGKILIAGSDGVRIRRYTQDGYLDNTFGQEGKVEGAFTLKDDREMKNDTAALRLQPSGKILVAGNATRSLPPYNVLYFMARFNSDGTVDKTFASNGKLIEGESEKATPEMTVENVLTDSEGNIFLIGYGTSSDSKKSLALHKFDKNGAHLKGPMHLALSELSKFPFQIKDSIIAHDSEIVILGESVTSDLNMASPVLVKFTSELEVDSNFRFAPKKGLVSGNYKPSGIGELPSGYVISTEFEANHKSKGPEMQIIKVDASGKEVIRVTENGTEPTSELPVRLLLEPGGKYSLLSSGSTTFNGEGLEYILLKFMP